MPGVVAKPVINWISESLYSDISRTMAVDAALVRVPESSQGIASRPSNQIAKVDNILGWFSKYRTKD